MRGERARALFAFSKSICNGKKLQSVVRAFQNRAFCSKQSVDENTNKEIFVKKITENAIFPFSLEFEVQLQMYWDTLSSRVVNKKEPLRFKINFDLFFSVSEHFIKSLLTLKI